MNRLASITTSNRQFHIYQQHAFRPFLSVTSPYLRTRSSTTSSSFTSAAYSSSRSRNGIRVYQYLHHHQQQRRSFSTQQFTAEERGSYDPERGAYVAEHKAVMQEGDWVCACPLGMRLSEATHKILTNAGWAKHEVERDVAEVKGFRTTSSGEMSVAQFQILPWYERFAMKRDVNQVSVGRFFTVEALKLLEQHLVPSSRRGDPYHHLRRREMEDDFRLFDEGPGRSEHCTRKNMQTATGKSQRYAQPSLAQYQAFRKEYVKRNGPTDDDVIYREWFTTFGYNAEQMEPRAIKW